MQIQKPKFRYNQKDGAKVRCRQASLIRNVHDGVLSAFYLTSKVPCDSEKFKNEYAKTGVRQLHTYAYAL